MIPLGVLLRWFMMLYELEIVEEDVFLKWREDINDEYPGKGKALFQVYCLCHTDQHTNLTEFSFSNRLILG